MFLDVPVGLWTHSNEIKLLDLKIEVRGDRTDDPGEERPRREDTGIQ